jgi:hypothetical protein
MCARLKRVEWFDAEVINADEFDTALDEPFGSIPSKGDVI